MDTHTEESSQTRRRKFTDEELEYLKEQLLESIYADIGKSIVKRFLWITGAVVGAFYAALSHKEKLIDLLKIL